MGGYLPGDTGGGLAPQPARRPRPGEPGYTPPTLPPAANVANTTFTGTNPMSNFNLPGWEGREAWSNNQATQAHDRDAFQSSNDSQFRGYQDSLAARLSRQVNGEDSLSQMALRSSTNQNLAQQRAMAAGASPGNVAMAQRAAMQGAGSINQGYGQQAAMLGIQERNAAAQSLAGLSGQARGQDLQNNQFNAASQAGNRGANDQYALGQGQLALANASGQQRGSMGMEANATQRYGIDANKPPEKNWFERYVAPALPLAAIPFMAEGGVATQPTQAVVGEAGPEAILPLDDLIGATQKRAPQLGSPQSLSQLNQPDNSHRDARMQYAQSMMSQPAKPDDAVGGVVQTIMGILNAHDKKAKAAAATGAIQGQLAGQVNRPSLVGVDEGMQPVIRPPTLMAGGGIVTKPTQTILGEQGPEAVVPLHELPGLIERLQVASRTKQSAGDSRGAPGPTVRPEELSRARKPTVRPEELSRARPSPRQASSKDYYMHDLRGGK